jgi:alkenylglycerophosphocholine/alkenylglycerophosphoethanolamine hydrolase
VSARGGAWAAAATVVLYYAAGLAAAPLAALALLKALPAALLAFSAWRGSRERYAALVALGLAISALADAAIEWRFLAGLVLFLAAHLAYIAAFVADVPRPMWVRAAPLLVVYVAFACFAGPHLGAMRAPVLAYAFVILTMIWRALARVGASPRGRASEHAAAWGAASFGCSDMLLAANRFLLAAPVAAFLVLPLYWLGQFGIAISAWQWRAR